MRDGLIRVTVIKNESGGFTVTSEHLESGRKVSSSDQIMNKKEFYEAREQHNTFIAKKRGG